MDLKPERVFYYFEEISKIPRASGNTKAVSDYCKDFAEKHGLKVRQDAWNNVVISKDASAGREKEKGIIIQGHLDMVAEKTSDSTHDFSKDGLELMTENGFLTAKNTTLGADDGIAIAIGLALLEDDTLSHPHLEAVFTTDEETGMDGAKNIDLSDVTGSYVLNLDSEDEGIMTAGCSGGAKIHTDLNVQREQKTGTASELCITGLRGGHSGVEIDKGRANAILLMGRLLKKLRKSCGISLVSISGGGKDNAIPRECRCRILFHDSTAGETDAVLKDFEDMVKTEYIISDPQIRIKYQPEGERTEQVLTETALDHLLFYLNNIPNGVQHYCQDLPELPETSLNIGIIDSEDAKIHMCTSVRSSVKSRKEQLVEKLQDMAEAAQGTIRVKGEYPEWSFKSDSALRKTMQGIYHELYGEEMKVDVIHAGLECGYLLQKKPELDIISFGPQMYDIHTTEERLSIASTEKTYRFVRKLIENGID